MFFTNMGRVYRIKAYEVPEAERTARGRAIVNLLQLQPDEKVNAVIPVVENSDHSGYLMLATKGGLVKRTDMEEYKLIRKVGKIAITLNEGDELISVQILEDGDEILLAASSGKCIRFSAEGVRGIENHYDISYLSSLNNLHHRPVSLSRTNGASNCYEWRPVLVIGDNLTCNKVKMLMPYEWEEIFNRLIKLVEEIRSYSLINYSVRLWSKAIP